MPTTLEELWSFVEEIQAADIRLNRLKEAERREAGGLARGQESAAVEREGTAERGSAGSAVGDTGAVGTADMRSRDEVETVLKKTLTVMRPSANEGQESVQDAPYTVIDKSFVHFFNKTCDLLNTFSPNKGIPLFIPWFVQSIEPRRSWMRLLYELILDKFNLYEGKFDSIAFLESTDCLPANFDLSSPRKLVIVDCVDVSERNRRLLDSSVSLVGFSRMDRANLQSELPKNACSFTPFQNCYWSEKLLLTRDAFKHLVKLSEKYRASERFTDDDVFEYFGGTGNLDCLVFPRKDIFISVHRKVVHQLEPRMRPAIEMLNRFVNKVRFCGMKAGSMPDDFGAWIILSRPFEDDSPATPRSQTQSNIHDESDVESMTSVVPQSTMQPASTESAEVVTGSPDPDTPDIAISTPLEYLRHDRLPVLQRSVLAVSEDHQSGDVLIVSDLCFPSIFSIRSRQTALKRMILSQAELGGIYTIGGQFIVTNACKVFYALMETYRLANQTVNLPTEKRRWHLTGIFGTGKTTILLICACAWLLQPEKYRVVHIASLSSFQEDNAVTYDQQMKVYFEFAFHGDSIVLQIRNADFMDPGIYLLIDDYLEKKNLVLVVIIDQLNEVDRIKNEDLHKWVTFVEETLSLCRNIFYITAASMNNDHRKNDEATRIDILNGFNEEEVKEVEKMFDSNGSQTTFAIENLGYRPIDVNFRVMGEDLQTPNRNAPSDLSSDLILQRLVMIRSVTYDAIKSFVDNSQIALLHKMEPVSIIANFESNIFKDPTLLNAIDRRFMAHVYIPTPKSYNDMFKIDSLYEYEKLLSQVDFRTKTASSDLVSTILPCNKIVWSVAFQIYADYLLKENVHMTKFYNFDRTSKGRPLENFFFFEMQTHLFDDSKKEFLKGYDVKTVNEDGRIAIEKGATAVEKIVPLGPISGVNSPICVKRMTSDLENLTLSERLYKNGLDVGESFIIQCNPFQTGVDFVIVLGMKEIFLVQVGFLTNSYEAMNKMLNAAVKCHRDRAIMFPVLYQGFATPTINFVFFCTIDPFTRRTDQDTSSMKLQDDGSVRYIPSVGSSNHQLLQYIDEHQNELKISLMFVEGNTKILVHTSGLKTFIMGSDSIQTPAARQSGSRTRGGRGRGVRRGTRGVTRRGTRQPSQGTRRSASTSRPGLRRGTRQPSQGTTRSRSTPSRGSRKSARLAE